MKNKSDVYLPNVRSYYEPKPEFLVSKSPEGISTTLANTAEDPIVSNNIACNEFSYIDDIYDDADIE